MQTRSLLSIRTKHKMTTSCRLIRTISLAFWVGMSRSGGVASWMAFPVSSLATMWGPSWRPVSQQKQMAPPRSESHIPIQLSSLVTTFHTHIVMFTIIFELSIIDANKFSPILAIETPTLVFICCNISKMYLIVNCDYLVFRFTPKLITSDLSIFA